MPVRTLLMRFAVLSLVLAACAGQEAGETPGEDIPSVPAPAAGSAGAPSSPEQAPITVADIERWKRGMDAELQAVQEAGARFTAARTGDDSLNAMSDANETSTRVAGARAAEVSEERYRFIRTTLSDLVKNLSPIEQEMDVSQMPAPMREQMQQGREAQVSRRAGEIEPAALQALRREAAALRRQDVALTLERLRAIGQGR